MDNHAGRKPEFRVFRFGMQPSHQLRRFPGQFPVLFACHIVLFLNPSPEKLEVERLLSFLPGIFCLIPSTYLIARWLFRPITGQDIPN